MSIAAEMTAVDSPLKLDVVAERANDLEGMLSLLPKDVVDELNAGDIDVHDPEFLGGLRDHLSREAIANPREGRHLLGKMIRLKKQLTRQLAATNPGAVPNVTVVREKSVVGRNDPCPCGSGRKHKQCCLRK